MLEDFLFLSFISPQAMLLFLLVLPVLTMLSLCFSGAYGRVFMYEFAMFSSVISLLVSLLLWYSLEEMSGGFQGVHSVAFVPSLPFAVRLGVDGFSIFFLILTNIFMYLCVLSLDVHTPRLQEALCHLFLLQWGVLASFVIVDVLGFFIFFEITLIPIYFLVLVWGSRERRVRASYMISIYTLLGSIFMFFNILYLYSKTGTTDYELLMTLSLTEGDQRFLWITFFLAFAAKIPMLPLHIWLPEAHVEAPTIGSVMLAVLLLKLGTYGIIRFSLPLFPEGTLYYAPLVAALAVMGIIYTCLTAMRQIDLKKIIAYSSVGHMNVVVLGIIAGSVEGLQGAVFQMLSHGIVSGALFFCVGVLYERYTVRSLKYYGGLVHLMPLFTMVFLVFSLANISFPLTSGFVGEFLIFMGLFQTSMLATLLASTSMVFGAVYTLWSFNRVFFGNLRTTTLAAYKDLGRKEVALFGPLLLILLFMGVSSSVLLNTFLVTMVDILEHSREGLSVLVS